MLNTTAPSKAKRAKEAQYVFRIPDSMLFVSLAAIVVLIGCLFMIGWLSPGKSESRGRPGGSGDSPHWDADTSRPAPG
jgi:hypothetical protein